MEGPYVQVRIKPIYDVEKVMREPIAADSDSYEETSELKQTAEEVDMS